jgi:hypothetical protein
MDHRSAGILVACLGALLLIVGGLLYTGALSWFGRLPGDIRIEGEHSRLYVPLVSMLLVSVLLSGALWLVGRWFR